jgi:hypothetical protein
MKRMLILAVTLWVSVSATAHAQVNSSAGTQPRPQVSAQTGAQVNSPTNAVYTATGAIVPSGQAVTAATGGSFIPFTSVAVPCPFGVSLSTDLTAFGCASDPLDASTYQILAESGATAVTTAAVGQVILPLTTVWLQVRVLPGPPQDQRLVRLSVQGTLEHRTRSTSLFVAGRLYLSSS